MVCLFLELAQEKWSRFVDIQHLERVWNLRSVNDKQTHGNRVQKNRRRQECQELTSKMCWHNIESEVRGLTILLHIRPIPIYVSTYVKLQSPSWVTWKRLWVIGDSISIHGCVTFFTPLREEGCCNSITSEELFTRTHVEIYEQNKTWWHINFRAHTTNTVKYPDRTVFSCSLQCKWDGSFTHCDTHYGLVCMWNMNICVVCSQSALLFWHFCCWNYLNLSWIYLKRYDVGIRNKSRIRQ